LGSQDAPDHGLVIRGHLDGLDLDFEFRQDSWAPPN
jgi:hypothetical protein